MKLSRQQVQRKTHALPDLQFEDQQSTSFAGLFLFQSLFQRLALKQRLRDVFRHLRSSRAYDHGLAVLSLVALALKGRHLNSLALQRQAGRPPLHIRPEGAVPFSDSPSAQEELGSAPSGRVGFGAQTWR